MASAARQYSKAREQESDCSNSERGAMEESQEILLNSLQSSGVSIPASVSSIRDLTPTTLFTICAQALNLIMMIDDDRITPSLPTSLPDSFADQFRICTEFSSAIKDFGYIGDMSFHKFLYPSEEDLYKLTRFLVEKLSQASKSGRATISEDGNGRRKVTEEKDQSEKNVIDKVDVNYQKVEDNEDEVIEENEKRENGALEDEEIAARRDDGKLTRQEIRTREEEETGELRIQERMLKEEIDGETLELLNLQMELELFKSVVEMRFDDYHSIDFYHKQLEEKIEYKRLNLLNLKSQWDSEEKTQEKKRRSLEDSLYSKNPEAQENLHKLREIELEIQSVNSNIKRRDEEHYKLSTDIEKLPKQASRNSYIHRVKEITKNSRKQDGDIDRILKETRVLQLESNSIQERLHRTYAVVDELVFREAKIDSVGRQAYRLLMSIHESFEQISEKIMATDRIQRECGEYEKKLTALATRRLDVEKLQADLDAIMKENKHLEQLLHDN